MKHQGINRNYSSDANDEYARKQEARRELEEKMKAFIAKGGKVEKLEPGAAAQVGGLLGKAPHYTDKEIKELHRKEQDELNRSKETGGDIE